MEENKNKTVGEKVRAWRKKKNLTQDILAKQANIPYTLLQNLNQM